MPDDNPPAPSDSPEDVTKSETIRITLPPKSEQPAVKRETVRINVPGKPVPPAPGVAPKKETSKLPSTGGAAAGGTPPPPPPGAGLPKPFAPPPPGAGAPMAPGAPKPPTLGGRPTVPLKPSIPIGSDPVTMKGASPKKETARITLPPENAKPSLPKATVKMQATQPLARGPSALAPAPTISKVAMPVAQSSSVEADPMMAPLGWALVVLSLAAAVIAYLVYSAAGTV